MWLSQRSSRLLVLWGALFLWHCHGLDDLNLVPDFEYEPFLHGVASADPLADRVLIWTRLSPSNLLGQQPPEEGEQIAVSWAVWAASDPGQSFDNPVRSSVTSTSASVDFTVTVDVDGLEQGMRYHYQFQDEYGRRSRLGTTKTLSTDASSVNVAFMSCTSLWSGYFNLYRHVASDDELDLVLHMGDFIYPEVSKNEMVRVPEGYCEDWYWSNTAAKSHTTPYRNKTKADNHETTQYVRNLIRSLNCSSENMLDPYRWVQGLYMLDPDLRAARAKHAFVVTLDNHDQYDYMSGRLPLDGSRQAAKEWVPQRTQIIKSEQTSFETSIRHFRLGGNLLDIILLDTYGCSGSLTMKQKEGLLGDSQHEWLDAVLQNSSSAEVQWRLFGSAKTFMPFVINRLTTSSMLPLGIVFFLFLGLVALCVAIEVFIVSTCTRATDYYELPQKQFVEPLEIMPLVERRTGNCPSLLLRSLKKIRQCHNEAPFLLRCCSLWGLVWLVVWTIVSIVMIIYLHRVFGTTDRLKTLNPALDVWEGQMGSQNRFFDQLEATGTDQNNFWATGDMHYSFAADVFRFDPKSKNSILNYSRNAVAKRYGVEMLPASGTRGNMDEMLGGFVPFLRPGSLLSWISDYVTNNMVSTMNPHFRYFQGQAHGYGRLTVTPTHMEASFLQFPILKKTNEFRVGKKLYVASGQNKWSYKIPPGADSSSTLGDE